MSRVLLPYSDLKLMGIPYSKPHLWRLERAGQFPRRVPIGASRYGYVKAEIVAYLDERVAARDAGADLGVPKPGRRRAADARSRQARATT